MISPFPVYLKNERQGGLENFLAANPVSPAPCTVSIEKTYATFSVSDCSFFTLTRSITFKNGNQMRNTIAIFTS